MKRLLILTSLCLLCTSTIALGDWNVGDPYKMHYPQLPDPNGWDVFMNTDFIFPSQGIGDDWLCTKTGPVSDIHFWVSWSADEVGIVETVTAQIYSNKPSGAGGYSEPNELRWQNTFNQNQFSAVQYDDSGIQGWYDPWYEAGPTYQTDNHQLIYQINIPQINDPFIQTQGEIYWLVLTVATDPNSDSLGIGWKTSLDHWGDDAVYMMNGTWQELRDPVTSASMDMAFVITPEPATIALLGLGGLLLSRSGKFNKKIT